MARWPTLRAGPFQVSIGACRPCGTCRVQIRTEALAFADAFDGRIARYAVAATPRGAIDPAGRKPRPDLSPRLAAFEPNCAASQLTQDRRCPAPCAGTSRAANGA